LSPTTNSSSGNLDFLALSCDKLSVCEKETIDSKENKKIEIRRSILVRPIRGLFV
jgi:hypothetical protein